LRLCCWQVIASEAAAAAVGYGLDAHKRSRAIAHISSTNAASIRVSQRIGMRYERDVDLYFETIGRYAIET
jgi:RimJ/RimL family protein N-acetyltransferase